MKTKSFLFAFFIGLFLVSCDKDDTIYYPPSGNHGANLLVKSSNSSVQPNQTFSMRADLNKQSKLKIKISNTSNYTGPAATAPKWLLSGENNWTAGTYQSHYQEFTATKRATFADLAIQFINSPGSARLDFYENSTQITKSIVINW